MPPKPVNSGKFLADQASMATAAMKDSLSLIGRDLEKLALPTSWIRQHPIAATATGAGAGLALGLLLTPRRGQSFKQRYSPLLAKLRSRNGHAPAEVEEAAEPRSALPHSSKELLKALFALAAKAVAKLFVSFGKSKGQSSFHRRGEHE
jgi:hypothetical protein